MKLVERGRGSLKTQVKGGKVAQGKGPHILRDAVIGHNNHVQKKRGETGKLRSVPEDQSLDEGDHV